MSHINYLMIIANFCCIFNIIKEMFTIQKASKFSVSVILKDELSLKQAIHNGLNDDEIDVLIREAVKRKKKQHSGALNIAKDNTNRPMILIGG